MPQKDIQDATKHHKWWKRFLEDHFQLFFDSSNSPNKSFRAVQHLKVWDTLLSKFPKLKVVWAHLGLSKELKHLDPSVHVFIIEKLFKRHPNLYADVSWDVLYKQVLMNHESTNTFDPNQYVTKDFNREVEKSMVQTKGVHELREKLEQEWNIHKHMVKRTGSVTGPTAAMAVYLQLFQDYPERFLTGTDFVSSFGSKEKFPGLGKGNGCVKDQANHARQFTDTSSLNMFLSDDAFRKIVLGGNYFKINNMEDTFSPPPLCSKKVNFTFKETLKN